MNKDEYIRELLIGRVWNPQLIQGALIFWHSSIPIQEAHKYISNLEKKLNESSDT